MLGLEFSSAQVALALLVFAAISVATIFLIKVYFGQQQKHLTEKYKNKVWKFPLSARTKYPEVNSFSYYKPFLLWGGLVATGSTLFAINWTQKEVKQKFIMELGAWEEEIQVIPRTAELKVKLPPPAEITVVPDEEIITDPPKCEDQEIVINNDEPFVPMDKPVVTKVAPPPVMVLPKIVEPTDIFKVVEQMPRFPGCEDIAGDNKAKEECAKGKLMEYIYKVVKYPAIARENGIEGSAVVQFTVGKNGEIEDITIVRNPGAGLGDAAKAAIESMNTMSMKWTPGKQRGVPVKVQYTVPLKFKLSN